MGEIIVLTGTHDITPLLATLHYTQPIMGMCAISCSMKNVPHQHILTYNTPEALWHIAHSQSKQTLTELVFPEMYSNTMGTMYIRMYVHLNFCVGFDLAI